MTIYDKGYVAFPFVLKDWERRRVLRYWPILHLDASTVVVNEDGTVTEWRDLSGDPNNPAAKALMPRWFRVWLWARTAVATIKR